jgi:hypothetical protein
MGTPVAKRGTIYHSHNMDPDGSGVRARAAVIHVEGDNFIGYLARLSPPLHRKRLAAVEGLGATVLNLDTDYSTVLLSDGTAASLSSEEVPNEVRIGEALMNAAFEERA